MGDIPELKSRDTEPYDISLSECEATYHVAKKTLKKYVEKYISEDNAGAYTIPCELVHTLVSYSAAVPKEQSEGPTVITADLLYNFFTKYDEMTITAQEMTMNAMRLVEMRLFSFLLRISSLFLRWLNGSLFC